MSFSTSVKLKINITRYQKGIFYFPKVPYEMHLYNTLKESISATVHSLQMVSTFSSAYLVLYLKLDRKYKLCDISKKLFTIYVKIILSM